MTESTNNQAPDDDAAERALRGGFKVNPLSPEAMLRIRAAAEQEWRESARVPAKPRSRIWAIAASLVGVFALMSAFLALGPGSSPGAVFGQVASLDSPGLIETRRFSDAALSTGSAVYVGRELEARGDSVVNLEAGGNLRVARASTIRIEAPDAVRITRGELYVDIPPGTHTASSFRVLTSAGEFRHRGTQFAVMISAGQTRLRVREGQVIWASVGAGSSTITAGTEVTIDGRGAASRRPIPTAGRDWSWTEALAPEVLIENRPLYEFLQWFARETGRELQMDDAAREQARTILMHGSVKGLTLNEALSAVMSATNTLKYELPEGVIRVSSTRAPNASRS